MFVEHKEAGEHLREPHLPAELEGWQRALLKAADTLETYGHVKDDIGGEDRGFCALGALLHTDGGKYTTPTLKALAKLQDAVGYIPSWNNRPERTKEEVVAKLRAVALGG